jgi:polyisoprenoid-binding protein YceI
MSHASSLFRMAALAVLIALPMPAGAAETFEIDAVHSVVLVRVQHLGVSNAYGRFNQISGSFTLDEKEPAKSSVKVEVRTASIDTFNEKRDQHLRGPDFFNAKQFPVMTFESSAVRAAGEGRYEVEGKLSVHGVTKPLTVVVEKVGAAKDPWGGFRAGFETSWTMKRSDHGMDYMLGAVGDEVRVIVSLEGIRK